MKKVIDFLWKYKLLILGLLIHISFYVSSLGPFWYDYFFSGTEIHHCCRSLDFYQIPNGAYAFSHGGTLIGDFLPNGIKYSQDFGSNLNVYHPFFTLIVGNFLILFSVDNSFYLWMYLKLLFTVILVFSLFLKYRHLKYFSFAIFLMLINSTQYEEIRLSQYQSALDIFFFLMLIHLVNKEQNYKILSGLDYFLTLIVKPIGILWAPVLFLKKQYKTLLIGLGLFIILTLLFIFAGVGNYYIDNIYLHLISPFKNGPIQIYTLDAVLRYSGWFSESGLSIIKFTTLFIICFLCLFRKVDLLKGIFLSTVFYFMFYDYVFEYQYTTLIPILFMGTVFSPSFQKLSSRILMVLIALPHAFFLLHFFNYEFVENPVSGPDPTSTGWVIIVLSKIIPILLLCFVVVKDDIKPIWKGIRESFGAFKKFNNKYKIFG